MSSTQQAVFAMPVIDWEGQGAPTTNKGFKYYWAVAIPLTICVLAAWSLAMVLPWRKWISNLRGNSKDEEALELHHIQ
jgi:hypothetical protein